MSGPHPGKDRAPARVSAADDRRRADATGAGRPGHDRIPAPGMESGSRPTHSRRKVGAQGRPREPGSGHGAVERWHEGSVAVKADSRERMNRTRSRRTPFAPLLNVPQSRVAIERTASEPSQPTPEAKATRSGPSVPPAGARGRPLRSERDRAVQVPAGPAGGDASSSKARHPPAGGHRAASPPQPAFAGRKSRLRRVRSSIPLSLP